MFNCRLISDTSAVAIADAGGGTTVYMDYATMPRMVEILHSFIRNRRPSNDSLMGLGSPSSSFLLWSQRDLVKH